MTDAVRQVEGEVRELIRRSGLDPARHPVEIDRLVRDAVNDYDERSMRSGTPALADLDGAAKEILDTVAGYGPLQRYFDDPNVEEIWINSPDRVFIARNGQAELTTTILTSDEVRDLVERMLRSSGRRVDLSSPFVDATLPDGSRLHVVIPDITRDHWHLNIRKFVVRADHLDDLVRLGTLTRAAATFLEAAVVSGLNILVAGGTQAGKTTLLGCLAACIPPRERVVTCEEVFELKIPLRDVAGMQCRQPSLEGTGAVPLRRLVTEALRMRPSRIIVGEVRQAESLDLLIALNSGLPGMCTLHANSAREAITKMCTLPLLAGVIWGEGDVCPPLPRHPRVSVRQPRGHDYLGLSTALGLTPSRCAVLSPRLATRRSQSCVRVAELWSLSTATSAIWRRERRRRTPSAHTRTTSLPTSRSSRCTTLNGLHRHPNQSAGT